MVFKKSQGFVPLNFEGKIKPVVSGKPVLQTLKSSGILVPKRNSKGRETYTTGTVSKSFTIGDKYHLDNMIELVFNNRGFIKKCKRTEAKEISEPKPGVERYLRKVFNDFELDSYSKTYCDLKRALTHLRVAANELGTYEHIRLKKRLPHLIKSIEDNGHTASQVIKELECIASYKKGRYATDMLQIRQFELGEIFFKRAPKGDRIFTTANLMPRDLRKFIKHKRGKALFEADIRNCQPLMLCGLLKKRYRGKWETDLLLYKDLCEKGKFYNYLFKVMYGIELDEMSEETRIRFKEKLFGYVYYCNIYESASYSEYVITFKKEFPTVYTFIIEYKTEHGYKALSTEMQRVESKLMINTVCTQLKDNKCSVLSIHDGLIVTEDEIEHTETLLQEAFEKKQGLMPEIARKRIKPHDIALYKRFDYLANAVSISI
ncbi:hypothetical protein [Pontibacter populi]